METYNVRPYWKGIYAENLIDSDCSSFEDDLPFHVVIIPNQIDQSGQSGTYVLVVPAYWVDQTYKYVLYPHPGFHLNGVYPQDWSERVFNLRRYPKATFVEYVVGDFGTDMTGRS